MLSASELPDFYLLGLVLMKIEVGHFMYKSKVKARSHNQCYRGKNKKYYIFRVCVCSFSHPAFKVHAPFYIVICDLSGSTIQSVYKRMVRFQKLIRNLLLTLHGHNVHRQQRKLSKFLMRYQQFASHA